MQQFFTLYSHPHFCLLFTSLFLCFSLYFHKKHRTLLCFHKKHRALLYFSFYFTFDFAFHFTFIKNTELYFYKIVFITLYNNFLFLFPYIILLYITSSNFLILVSYKTFIAFSLFKYCKIKQKML